MENMGQIDANQREMIIDQIMSLGDSTISLDDLPSCKVAMFSSQLRALSMRVTSNPASERCAFKAVSSIS
jgi:hypothetical protein